MQLSEETFQVVSGPRSAFIRESPESVLRPLSRSHQKELAAFLLPALAKLSEKEIWWPFPELNAEIDFELINPKTNKKFFHAGPERTYWLNKWMNPESYDKYKKDQSKKMPRFSVNYNLKYRINGKSYDWSS